MIKFFRKIRQNMITGNKVSKYFLYAFGEILLVVIGILIALQINNWNENKKAKETELYVLSEVLNNLNEDAILIDEIIDQRERAQESTFNMLGYLKQDSLDIAIFSKDMRNFLCFERYFPINNAYEVLKSKGLKLSNDNLTTRISRYYDYEQNKMNYSIKDIENTILNILNDKNSIIRFIDSLTMNKVINFTNPNNPIFKNEIYRELVAFKDNNGGTLEKLYAFSDINQTLIADLDQELHKLQN